MSVTLRHYVVFYPKPTVERNGVMGFTEVTKDHCLTVGHFPFITFILNNLKGTLESPKVIICY